MEELIVLNLCEGVLYCKTRCHASDKSGRSLVTNSERLSLQEFPTGKRKATRATESLNQSKFKYAEWWIRSHSVVGRYRMFCPYGSCPQKDYRYVL